MTDTVPTFFTASPLLGAGDPLPLQVLNPHGKAPLLLVCDHASNAIPQHMKHLGLGPKDQVRHIAWDIGAAEVTRRLAERLDAPAVLAGYSRLLVDCNRAPGDPTSIAQISDGTVIPGNWELTEAATDLRLETFYWPYHHAITNTLAHIWRQHGIAPAVIAIHSFTPVLGNHCRPWHVGILWNRDPRLALPILERLRAYPDLCVGDNEPYSGRLVGYTLGAHAGASGLPHVEFEIRQDLLSDEVGCAHWADRVATILEAVLADPAVHAVVHF